MDSHQRRIDLLRRGALVVAIVGMLIVAALILLLIWLFMFPGGSG